MCDILLSINPEHVENILKGIKKYEYRKIACRRRVDKIIIYSTTPIKKVVGEAEVIDILQKEKDELWHETENESGITKTFFDEYYKNKETAVAYKLGKVTKFEKPKELQEYGIKCAPQSFVYI